MEGGHHHVPQHPAAAAWPVLSGVVLDGRGVMRVKITFVTACVRARNRSATRLADERSAETDGAVSAPLRCQRGVSASASFQPSHDTICPAPLVMGVKSPSILTGFDGTANQVVGEGSSGVEAEPGRVSRWW